MNFWAVFLPILIYTVNLISMISIIFIRKKEMSVTFAWLLVLIFLPLVGFVLYFFFGSTYKLELMSKRYRMPDIEKEYDEGLRQETRAMESEQISFKDSTTEKYRDMILMNSRNSRCFYSEDNSVELLVNGEQKFPRLFSELESAKESINVLYFIIKAKDQIGREFIELLAKKAREGVKVRLVYDGFGWLKTSYRDFKPIEDAGGIVQRFLPSLVKTILEVNYRLHRKMVIIDGQVAYTGGINVGDDYLGRYPKMSPWRDTSVRLTGSGVRELQLRFMEDWVFLEKQNPKIKAPLYKEDLEEVRRFYFPEPKVTGDAGVQIVSCGPDSKYQTHKDSYVKLISSAKEYVYIQSPYFVPDEVLLETMRLAAASGVDVRLMLPGIPDKKFVYYVALSYVQELLEAGISVYFHKGFLHAKTFVSDDHVSSVGTTNLDIRSFKLDYEVNTLVYNTAFANTCKQQYLLDILDSRKLCLEDWNKRSGWHYICESICRFVAPLA